MMFEPLIQQLATNSTILTGGTVSPSVVTSFEAILVAVVSLAGTIGAIIHSVAQRGTLKNHKAALETAADLLKTTGDHIVESKEDIRTLAEVTYNMLPEQAEKIINAQSVKLDELNKKIQTAQGQLARVPGALNHI